MTFWILAAVLSVGTIAAVVLPVLRARGAARRAADYDIEVYRDQLAEVERNRKRGMIAEAEAEAAKAEIGRRILEADQRRQQADSAGRRSRRWVVRSAAALSGLAVPIGAVVMYLNIGNPGMDAYPLSARNDVGGQTQTARGGGGGSGSGSGSQQGGSLEEAAANLERRLEQEPGDTQGWILLGRTRLSLGQYDAAVAALERAVTQQADSPSVQAMYGEALVMANQGTVVPKAQQAFEKVLAQRPNEPRSQFYLGLAAQQAGDLQAALQRWRELVAGARPDAPYLDAVAQRMAQVERELGIEPGTTFAEVEPDAPAGGAATGQAAERSGAGGSGSRPRGPTREQMQAAQDMSPEQRQQMVQGMVQGLAARLAENPDDPAGWRRLIRSYVVLGREDDAREALTTALDTFQDRARTRRELINLARGLNLRLPEGVEPPPQTAQGGGQAGGTGQQGSGARGPTQQQMQAAQDMTPEQRQAMVRSMVERLRGRLEDNPDNLQGWLQLGRSYDVLGQSEKAVEAYSQAAELAPEDPEVLGRYARAVRQDAGQQTQRSVELSRRVLELDPTNPEALWFTAMAELRQGNKNEARRLFDKALAQLPADTPQTAELRKRADEMLQSN